MSTVGPGFGGISPNRRLPRSDSELTSPPWSPSLSNTELPKAIPTANTTTQAPTTSHRSRYDAPPSLASAPRRRPRPFRCASMPNPPFPQMTIAMLAEQGNGVVAARVGTGSTPGLIRGLQSER